MVATRRRETMGKAENNKNMLKILPFIQILYFKQQSSIL